jgi:diguanylate cyclase (GGDEF)-like protein/PAS domain S-box-containing protein
MGLDRRRFDANQVAQVESTVEAPSISTNGPGPILIVARTPVPINRMLPLVSRVMRESCRVTERVTCPLTLGPMLGQAVDAGLGRGDNALGDDKRAYPVHHTAALLVRNRPGRFYLDSTRLALPDSSSLLKSPWCRPTIHMYGRRVRSKGIEEHRLMSINADGASSSRTVLVADDDAPTRLLLRAALEPDGAHACELAERVRPDVILLDVGMPDPDGFETCARLRALPGGQHVPVMMITAMDDQASVSRAYEVGATDFLSKPFNFTILRERLRHLHRAEQDRQELLNERDFVSAVVEHSAALVLILDPTGRIVRFNESCERVSGLSLGQVRDKRVWDVLSSPEDRDRERVTFERLISQGGTNHCEGSWTAKDGTRHDLAWSNSVLLDSDGDVEHVVCTGLDVTARHQAEEQVLFLASYDPLTGLPNRRLITERLEQAITAGESLAVLVLDLDRSKDVNATWGYPAGDQLLTEVADRLTKSLRLSDVLARHNSTLGTELGRLGGDQFTALVAGVSDAGDVATIIERLQHALGRPFKVKDRDYRVTASVGAALCPADGSDSGTLLTNAESAMHAAQETMRGSYHFYSATMHATVSERLSLESDLREALERDEFVLHYQPKQFTQSGRLAGAEALVRWQHPSLGLLAPASFIEVAEETGLIVEIGERVLRQACGQVMSWLESGLKAVPVAVNLSSAQFRVADLLGRIGSVLNETTLDLSYLAVEITESMIMRDTGEAQELLRRLKGIGVQVAIDDFGTGYSTLSALKELPLHHLKIDQAFIRNLAEGGKDVAITRAIINMSHGLGLTVIAEGVESEEQLAILREEKCDQVQGFLIGHPLPSDEFAALLDHPTRQAVEDTTRHLGASAESQQRDHS